MGHGFHAFSATARKPIPKDKRPEPAHPLPEPEQSRRLRDLMQVKSDRAGIIAMLIYTNKARTTADGGLELLTDAKYPPDFETWYEALLKESEDEIIGFTDTEVVLLLLEDDDKDGGKTTQSEGAAGPAQAPQSEGASGPAQPVITFNFYCGYGSCDEVMGHVRRFTGDASLRFPPDQICEHAWAERVLTAMCAAAPSFCAAKGLTSGVPEGEATAWFRLPEWSAPKHLRGYDCELEVYRSLGRLCLVACMSPTGVINCS